MGESASEDLHFVKYRIHQSGPPYIGEHWMNDLRRGG